MPRAKPTAAGEGPAYADPAAADRTATGGTEAGAAERKWAAFTHVLGLLTLFLGPLVAYLLLRRDASPWLRGHLREALNYHILLVAAFVLVVVALVFLAQVTVAVTVLALVLLLLVAAHVVVGVLAVVQAARGRSFHHPLGVRIVR